MNAGFDSGMDPWHQVIFPLDAARYDVFAPSVDEGRNVVVSGGHAFGIQSFVQDGEFPASEYEIVMVMKDLTDNRDGGRTGVFVVGGAVEGYECVSSGDIAPNLYDVYEVVTLKFVLHKQYTSLGVYFYREGLGLKNRMHVILDEVDLKQKSWFGNILATQSARHKRAIASRS